MGNFEKLWYSDTGITQGNSIYFSRKNYTIYAFVCMGSIIYIAAPTTLKDITCGAPCLLWNGSDYIPCLRCIIFDAYQDHFYIKSCADYDLRGNGKWDAGRSISIIYGIK